MTMEKTRIMLTTVEGKKQKCSKYKKIITVIAVELIQLKGNKYQAIVKRRCSITCKGSVDQLYKLEKVLKKDEKEEEEKFIREQEQQEHDKELLAELNEQPEDANIVEEIVEEIIEEETLGERIADQLTKDEEVEEELDDQPVKIEF